MSENYNYEGNAAYIIVCFIEKNLRSIIISSVPRWRVLVLNFYRKQKL